MEQALLMVLKRPGNDLCADCGGRCPRFASISLAVALCNRCFGIHRSIGTYIARTKNEGLDRWTSDEVHRMSPTGSVVANSYLEEKPLPIFQRPNVQRKLLPSSSARNFTPLPIPQNVSYAPFWSTSQQFRQRISRRLNASSSEPPLPLLHSKVISKEHASKGELITNDCTSDSSTTVPNPLNVETESSTGKVKDESVTTMASLISKDGDREWEISMEAATEECRTSASSAVPMLHALEQGTVQEVAKDEFQRSSIVSSNDMTFKNRDPSSLGRQRKRKTVVAKRLCSDEEDLSYMQEALVEARKAAKEGEVPVGAVLVHKNKIIARFYNQVETTNDPTAHAEMLCIRSAAAQLGGWRLTDTTMYVTLEPCPMCAGAILQGRVSELVWGAPNSLLGADGSWIKLFPVSSSCEHEPKSKDYLHPFHRSIAVRRGVLADESADVMQTFFATRRQQPKCRSDNLPVSLKSAPWPRSPGWFPPALKKLNSWVRRWFHF